MRTINRVSAKLRRRDLRENQTEAERVLWSRLRNRRFRELKFNRQVSIGHYVADFYCAQKKLVIELDGSQHMEETAIEYDSIRTEYLNNLGIKVLRFSNTDILMNIDGVLESLYYNIEEPENVME
ncbi:MAG TPA: endonuclease domain-containing protein [Candidatus Cloacimonadota bacterium]|nr:endonuclease domain-containing protein [Candidatus Cloacimonadota bacterium]HPT70737.1 endonuclease domain-containing protein [Candidatus Cloacimonadota bacterium]